MIWHSKLVRPRVYPDECTRKKAQRKRRLARDPLCYIRQRNKKLSIDPLYYVRLRLNAVYGVDIADVISMFERQNGKCASCGAAISSIEAVGHKGWGKNQQGEKLAKHHIDHCSKRLVIRGLLCPPCNVALGTMGECPMRLRKLAEYIEAHSRGELPTIKMRPRKPNKYR